MLKFIPGLELNRGFYYDVIKGLMEDNFPELSYSAALLGYGSDVLGVDTDMSMDHNWGPRSIIFLSRNDIGIKDELYNFFSNNLPFEYKGYPVNFSDPAITFVQFMEKTHSYPIRHLIEIHEFESYFEEYLNPSPEKWSNFKDQVLIELTSGEVFHDGLNKLIPLRENLSFYPNDIAKLKLASLWFSIWNEEPFIGRSIDLDDFIGLKSISVRIVTTILKILFYIEKRYIPYSKWFGTLTKELDCYPKVSNLVFSILKENNPDIIITGLSELYTLVVELHNSSGYLPRIENVVQDFHNRPYKVIFGDSIAETLVDSVQNEKLKSINLNTLAIDIKLESVDFTE